MGVSTETAEQTSITVADPGESPGERGRLPIISTVFSLSTTQSAEGPEEQEMEIDYVSIVTKDFEPFDPKEQLTGKDLQIKKEMVEEDLHPSDPGYYANLQYSELEESRKDCRNLQGYH